MMPLAIDFVGGRRRHVGLLGLTVLLAGGACLAAASLELDDLDGQVAAAQSRLRSLTRGAAGRAAPAAPPIAKGNGASAAGPEQTILPRLQTPWHELLGELEATADLPVALMSIDADGRGRTLRLAGEARSIEHVLAFVERLRASRRLDEAYLVNHEEHKAGAVTVVGFTVQATWPEARDVIR